VSLRFRLNLMIALTMLIIIGVGTLFVIHHARRSVLEEVRSSVNMALQLIDAGLAHAGGNEGTLIAWLAELAHMEKTRHLRIHVEQPMDAIANGEKGRTGAREGEEVQGGLQQIIKLDAPPEQEADARVPAWFAWAVTPQPLVGEKRVERSNGRPMGILVEANPGDEIAEAWSEAEDLLYLIVALAIAVCVLVHTTLGRAFKSVGVILHGLEAIERGNYGRRLPRFSLPEFDRISQACNHTAEVLAKAREENRALTQQSLAIQEEERRHLARELHDELGQSLSAIKVMAASLRKSVNVERGGEAVEAIIETCDRLFGVVRAMMRRLRPMLLDELGLVASLEDMIESWRDRNPGVRVEFHCEAGVEECAGSAKIHLFRIAQECLTNVVKHAEARNVSIQFRLVERQNAPWILLEVSDDGKGFDPAQPLSGFGLLGMKERVASLGGVFILTTHPGEGVTIEVQVPCREETT